MIMGNKFFIGEWTIDKRYRIPKGQVKYVNQSDIGTIYNGRLKQVGSDWTGFMFYRTSHMFSIVASPAVLSNIYLKSVIQLSI
jgi:hypothetical protein